MTGWRALVVEDVPLMRSALVTILRGHRTISHVDEAGSISSAGELIGREAYDAVFLDVHLPDGYGVELGRIAHQRAVPAIVYCTADPSFAVDAFRQEAVDYLLKPVTATAVEQALARAERRTEGTVSMPRALAIRDGAKMSYIAAELVERVEAAGHYQCVHAAGEVHLLRQSSAQIHEQLGPGFVRVHRAMIVRTTAIRSLETERSGDGVLHPESGATARFSRTYRETIEVALTTK